MASTPAAVVAVLDTAAGTNGYPLTPAPSICPHTVTTRILSSAVCRTRRLQQPRERRPRMTAPQLRETAGAADNLERRTESGPRAESLCVRGAEPAHTVGRGVAFSVSAWTTRIRT